MIPSVTASEAGRAHPESCWANAWMGVVGFGSNLVDSCRLNSLECDTMEGDSPVCLWG